MLVETGAERSGTAAKLAALVEPLFGGALPVRLRAWDGSEAGPADAPVVVLKSRKALRRLAYHRGELGLAQAYVTGEMDVEGDLFEGFRRIWAAVREKELVGGRPPLIPVIKTALRYGVIGLPPKAPASQAKVKGAAHSLRRDRQVISHHYDLSNDFYRLILDPNMAYSCGYYVTGKEDVKTAQDQKLELIARKLGVSAGARHLDIGCGWGSLSLYLAEQHRVNVLGVTIAKEQKAFIDARIKERGLEHLVEIRLQDYREVSESGFDTVSSIEMGEHVGAQNYPMFVNLIHARLREGGRCLIQQMSRRDRPGGGEFIEAYIAPDMHMRPVGQTISLIEDSGLEVRDVQMMREHYVKTILAWYHQFESNYDRAVAMVGEEVARVWRLYMVGSALVFEEGRMGVDQILAVRKSAAGVSGMPYARTFEPAR